MQQKRTPKTAGACCGLTLALALLVSVTAYSGPITLVPTDLNPGDTYHLAFVSSTLRDATSTDIAVYDAFVQAAALAAGGGLESISWKVIGSTATVDAIDHIGVSGPVYRLDNTRIANDEADLFGGAVLFFPLNLNENGFSQLGFVYTGFRLMTRFSPSPNNCSRCHGR